jgi:ubiquinone/menaquinone biosynthesis C-methylase UbiE
MSDDWGSADLAAGFHLLEGVTEREVGFPSLFAELGLGNHQVQHVLDYGCGTGRAARLIAERYGVNVTAVDISAAMLRIARQDHPHPKVEHHLLGDERLGFLADGSIDAAMSCFVFINIAEETELGAIAAEVCRLLRSGGRYVIMDSNPEATGIRFRSFQTGEPGRLYRAGEQRPVQLYNLDGHTVELTDYHWPTDTYERILRDAGFREVRMCQPTLKQNRDCPTAESQAEAMHPPLLLVTAEK